MVWSGFQERYSRTLACKLSGFHSGYSYDYVYRVACLAFFQRLGEGIPHKLTQTLDLSHTGRLYECGGAITRPLLHRATQKINGDKYPFPKRNSRPPEDQSQISYYAYSFVIWGWLQACCRNLTQKVYRIRETGTANCEYRERCPWSTCWRGRGTSSAIRGTCRPFLFASANSQRLPPTTCSRHLLI